MKRALIAALVLALLPTIAQSQTIAAVEVADTDSAPEASRPRLSSSAGTWLYDLDVGIITGDTRCLGVEFDGTDWWISAAYDLAAAKLYQISYNGILRNTFEQFNSPGDWGWRDLAWDGEFLYASDSYDIEQIDPDTGTATGVTITTPISPARALAYDSVTDSFWTADFGSSIYNVQRDGSFTTHPNSNGLSIYGMAMDEIGDVLWIWSQNGSGVLASAFDPRSGTFTGESWDGFTGIASSAAGCCIFKDPHPAYDWVFAGMQQAQTQDDVASVYDLDVSTLPILDIKCNGGNGAVVVASVQNVKLTIDIAAREGAGVDVDIWCLVKPAAGSVYSYDGFWHPGLNHAAWTGPLFNLHDVILDRILPVGDYVAYLVLDTDPNGVFDLDSISMLDSVDFNISVLAGFFEDFEDGVADDWTPDGPHWSVQSGAYYLNTPAGGEWRSHYDKFVYGSFTFGVDMRMLDTGSTSGGYDYGLYFRSNGTLSNCYTVYANYSGEVFVEKREGGLPFQIASGAPPSFIPGVGNWNNIRVDVRGNNIDVYINGVLEFSISDSTFSAGKSGLWGDGSGIYDLEYEFDNADLDL